MVFFPKKDLFLELLLFLSSLRSDWLRKTGHMKVICKSCHSGSLEETAVCMLVMTPEKVSLKILREL